VSRPTRAQIVATLRQTYLLRPAPKQEIEALATLARLRPLEEGDVLFARNALCSSVYVVVQGRIRISSIDRAGQEFLLGMVEVGEMFGELALVDESRRIVTAIADLKSTVLSIGKRELMAVLDRNPDCCKALTKILAAHLRVTVNKLESVGLHDARRRLWSRIISLGRRYGKAGSAPGGLRVQHGMSQEKLASSVGLTRVMVSRQLSLWRDKGLIDYGRGFVEIQDLDALEDFVWREWPEAAARSDVA
jgi:CRP-like cAMP-binding protein